MSTLIHIHVPGDAPDLWDHLRSLGENSDQITIIREGDSYREWGEPYSEGIRDDAEHVVVQVPLEEAEMATHNLGGAGIPVDATLAEDYTAMVSWGLGERHRGWIDRFHPEMTR